MSEELIRVHVEAEEKYHIATGNYQEWNNH